MRKFLLIFFLSVLLIVPISIFSRSASTMTVPSISGPNIPGWTLTFDDEFDGTTGTIGTTLDRSNYLEYWGEASTYGTASWWNGKEALTVQDGLLRVKIAQEEVSHNGKTYQYTAGGFNQLTAQTYGRWVVRARLPQGAGIQSYLALFRQDFNWPPEIDFAEVRGILPNENIFTQHYLEGDQHVTEVSKLYEADYTADFHEYTVIWEAGTLTWLVDGVEKFTTTQKFEAAPMILAVGDLVGTCDSFASCPNATTPFPTYLDIDYIRIYQKRTQPGI